MYTVKDTDHQVYLMCAPDRATVKTTGKGTQVKISTMLDVPGHRNRRNNEGPHEIWTDLYGMHVFDSDLLKARTHVGFEFKVDDDRFTMLAICPEVEVEEGITVEDIGTSARQWQDGVSAIVVVRFGQFIRQGPEKGYHVFDIEAMRKEFNERPFVIHKFLAGAEGETAG
jgi:hypothetical protein